MQKVSFLCMLFLCLMTWDAQSQIDHAAQDRQRQEARFKEETRRYRQACITNNIAAYKEYLRLYPNGHYAGKVKARVAEFELKEETLKYQQACRANSLNKYRSFLILYPNGHYADSVKMRVAEFELWEAAKTTNTAEGYHHYLSQSQFGFFILLSAKT